MTREHEPASLTTPPARELTLSDGRHLVARRADPGDADAIIRLYEDLSPRARHLRFLHPTPTLTTDLQRLLTDLARAEVWLAYDGDVCVGEVRLAHSDQPGCADMAVTVADDYQRSGLGRQLARLASLDRAHPEDCISVTILPDNDAARRLAQSNHIRLHYDSGVLEGEVSVAAIPRAGRAAAQ